MNKSYFERASVWKSVVKEQLIESNADIIFYGNTWDSTSINPIEPNDSWKDEFCTNKKEYIYKSDKGKTFRIFILKYRDTNKILINGYHPAFGNSAKWQTEFIKDYLSSNSN